jgi:hypothetical protein
MATLVKNLIAANRSSLTLMLEAGETVLVPINGRILRGYSNVAFMITKGSADLSYTIENLSMIESQIQGRMIGSNKTVTMSYAETVHNASPSGVVSHKVEYPPIKTDIKGFTKWQAIPSSDDINVITSPFTALLFEAKSDCRVVVHGDL